VSDAGKVFAVAVLVALAWAIAPVADAEPPIRIGASLSLTGSYAAIGPNLHRGYQLCVKHMNDKGGVLGRKLELVHYDNGSDPATAVRLYEKLITQEALGLRRHRHGHQPGGPPLRGGEGRADPRVVPGRRRRRGADRPPGGRDADVEGVPQTRGDVQRGRIEGKRLSHSLTWR